MGHVTAGARRRSLDGSTTARQSLWKSYRQRAAMIRHCRRLSRMMRAGPACVRKENRRLRCDSLIGRQISGQSIVPISGCSGRHGRWLMRFIIAVVMNVGEDGCDNAAEVCGFYKLSSDARQQFLRKVRQLVHLQ